MKRTKGLAIALTALVTLIMVLESLTALLSPIMAHDMALLDRGVLPRSMGLFWTDVGIQLLESLAFVVAGVLTMVWMAQVRSNAELLSPEVNHRRSKVWAWLGWIIPFVSMWFPFQVVRDVRRALDPREDVRRGVPMAGVLLGWWWFFFLVANALSSISSRMETGPAAGSSLDAIGIRYLDPAVGVATLVAGILWILIVRSIEQNQAARATQVFG